MFIYVIPVLVLAAFFVVLAVVLAAVKILREYERAVVFTLGRFQRVRGPGLVLLLPFVQEMVRVDLRIQVIEIPSQDVISRDNVPDESRRRAVFQCCRSRAGDYPRSRLSSRHQHARSNYATAC